MKVELICFLYNTHKVDVLDIPCDDLLAKITIDTNDIESVRERGKDGQEEEICTKTCMIYCKSGQSFQVGKGYKEMLKIWNNETK